MATMAGSWRADSVRIKNRGGIRMFNPNSTILFLAAGLVIVFVIAQSVFFFARSWRRGKALGMDMVQIISINFQL